MKRLPSSTTKQSFLIRNGNLILYTLILIKENGFKGSKLKQEALNHLYIQHCVLFYINLGKVLLDWKISLRKHYQRQSLSLDEQNIYPQEGSVSQGKEKLINKNK